MTYPTIMPAITLDFQNSQQLDPRVAFSRTQTTGQATYINSAGNVAYANSDEARFEFNSNGNCLGLLIEESRTNLIPNSQVFQTGFSIGAFTPVDNAAVAPDGTTTAASLLETAANDAHYVQLSSTSQTDLSQSIFVKPNGRDNICLRFVTGGGDWHTITFNLTGNGSITQEISSTSSNWTINTKNITQLSNGWYRISAGATTSAATIYNFNILGCDSSTPTLVSSYGFPRYTGDITKGYYVWGAQVEANSLPTSYIPTSGSTVTRAIDIAQLSTANVYGNEFTIINKPFGVSSGSDTLHLQGHPHVERAAVYNEYLSQQQINTVASKTDDWWEWRVVGADFGLSFFSTDGQVTVDWGDGTVETLTTAAHTFTNGSGYHTVKFRLDSGTYFRPQGFNTTTHTTKLKSIGPAPTSMVVNPYGAFFKAAGLETFDATVTFNGSAEYLCSGCTSLKSFPFVNYSGVTFSRNAWSSCSSLTSFPQIDTSNSTDFRYAWTTCSSLTSFPQIDTSNSTDFLGSWWNCSSLTSFPALDFSSATGVHGLRYTWRNCSSLTSFPFIDTGTATSLEYTWGYCSSLTSFPLIDTSNITSFAYTWYGCASLTSFPLINVAAGTSFRAAWFACNSLTTFPANFFDSWTGTPVDYCLHWTWRNCTSLTATSVENILNSIDTSGQSAPSTGVDITISYNASSGTPNITTAVTNLKSRGWTITLNNVAQ